MLRADSTRPAPRDTVARAAVRPVPVPTSVTTPDKEGDPSGAVGSEARGALPDSLQLALRAGLGTVSTLVGHDFLGFRSDSIRVDPVAEHGAGYQVAPGDFTRDNLKLLRVSASPDVLADLTLGDVMAAKKLRVLLGGTLERTSRYTELERNYEAVDADNNVYLIRRQFRPLGREQARYGVSARAAYTFDARNEVALSLAGSLQYLDEASLLYDTNYVNVPLLNVVHGTVHQSRMAGDVTLSGHHVLGLFDLRWRGVWSVARQDQPDHAELNTAAALVDSAVASSTVFSSVLRDWQRSDDRGGGGGLEISWSCLSELSVIMTAGGAYRSRERENRRNIYRLVPVTDSANRVPLFTGVDDLRWKVLNASGTPEFANNNYTSREDVAAGYLMGCWSGGAWDLLAGARVEATDARYATQDATVLGQVSASKSYVDLLPSLTARYALSDAASLRFSAGESITRPRFYDLVPYNYMSGEFRLMGNPHLRRTLTTSLDLSAEIIPAAGSRITGGLFYKRIIDPIESTLDLSNPALPTILPNNLANATALGMRAAGSIDLTAAAHLEGSWLYTHTAVTSPKLMMDRGNGRVLQVPETRPLQGEPEWIATLVLAVARREWGTSGRLQLLFTGRRLQQVSLYKGTDHYEEPVPLLGLSVEQRVVENLTAFFRIDNLLNVTREVRLPDGTEVEREKPGMIGMLGASWRY